MRVLRVLAIILAALLVATVLAAWLAPRFLDWNRYREDIERLAASVLDRPVLIEGPIGLQLLPHPVLTAADVRIAGEPGQGTLSAHQLSLGVALAPLLAGRLDARELVLRGAAITLPWPLPHGALPVPRPGWLAGLSARVEDGRLTVGAVEVTGLAATFAVGGATGGFQVSGSAQVFARPWRFAARLGAAGADNAATLDLAIDGDGPMQGFKATFAGQISPDGAGGRLVAAGPDLAQLLPAPSVAFSADGRLTVAGGLAAADDLALVIGGALANGAVSLRVSPGLRIDLALTASRLDLDAWMPALAGAKSAGYPIGLDLSAEAAQLAGWMLRRLRAAFELTPARLEIREATAVLPGEAALRLSGAATRAVAGARAGWPRFEGTISVVAPDLRSTLRWLDPSGLALLQALPPTVLTSAKLSAQASLGPYRIGLSNLAGTLDNSNVSGRIALGTATLVAGKLPAVQAELKIDRLELDPWLPATLPARTELSALLGRLDGDLRLQVGQAVVRGRTMTDLLADGSAGRGRLTVRRLEAKSEGARVTLSGAVDASGRLSGVRLSLAAAAATPFADLLPSGGRLAAGLWRAPLTLEIAADGLPEAVVLGAHATLGDADLDLKSTLDLRAGRGSGSAELHHPAAQLLLQSAGWDELASWLGAGPLALRARLVIGRDRISADEFDIAAGGLRAGGALALDRTGEQPRATGRLAIAQLPLPPVDLRAPAPLPIEALHGWEATVQTTVNRVVVGPGSAPAPVANLSGTVELGDGRLRIADVAGSCAGGSLSAVIGLDATGEPPALALEATVNDAIITGGVFGLPLDIVAGRASGGLHLAAAGHSAAALLATLEGRIDATLRDGALAGVDLPALSAALRQDAADAATDQPVRSALDGGLTRFDQLDLKAVVTRGVLDLGGSTLLAPAGRAAVSGSVDLSDRELDLAAAIRPAVPDAPEIRLRVTGAAGALRRFPDLADVTRWRLQQTRAQ